MIQTLVNILIFDKTAASQTKLFLWKKFIFQSGLKTEIIIKNRILCSPTLKTTLREKHLKVLGSDYTKMKASYKYAHISEIFGAYFQIYADSRSMQKS